MGCIVDTRQEYVTSDEHKTNEQLISDFIDTGRPLSNLDLRGIDFSKVKIKFIPQIRTITFDHCNLDDTDLRKFPPNSRIRPVFNHCEMRRTNFSNTAFYGAIFTNCSLQSSNFRSTTLNRCVFTGSNLYDADLRGADFWGTAGDGTFIKSIARLGEYPIVYTADRMQIGCINKPISEWLEVTEEDANDIDDYPAVEFHKKYRKLLRKIIKLDPARATK